MSNDHNAARRIIEQIDLAREHARLENFDAALRAYDLIRQDIEFEIENCKNPAQLAKWNAMEKDIGSEEASIRRIKVLQEEILTKMENDDSNESPQLFVDINDPLEPPQWSYNDDIVDLQPNKKLRGRDRRAVIEGVRTKKQPIGKQPPGFNITHIKAQPKPYSRDSGRKGYGATRKDVQPKNRTKTPGKPQPQQRAAAPVAPEPVSAEEAYDRPNIDLMANPLAQQIIDMGILVREPNVLWEQIAGLAQVKRLLRQNLVILPMRPDICKGLLAPWKSVLFYGPPGTGKTFLAKAVATECKRTFFNVTSATITSRFHGESEKLVSYLFDLADQMGPSTIFFDEIDSVASKRGGESEHEASRKMKAQLLTKLEGIDGASDNPNVFVLAATNFPWDLDEALLRRFQKRIYIPLPDVEGRLAILKMNIIDIVDDEFDMDGWTEKLEGYSCADITNLCRDAAQRVFDRQMEQMDTEDWVNMSADQARVIITDYDFSQAVANRKSSVDQSTLKRYDEWRLSKGAE